MIHDLSKYSDEALHRAKDGITRLRNEIRFQRNREKQLAYVNEISDNINDEIEARLRNKR